jgi:hypothetical protein
MHKNGKKCHFWAKIAIFGEKMSFFIENFEKMTPPPQFCVRLPTNFRKSGLPLSTYGQQSPSEIRKMKTFS